MQRVVHPDKGGSVEASAEVSQAFEKINTLSKNEQEQFDFIRNVYLFYHLPEPSNAYLFFLV